MSDKPDRKPPDPAEGPESERFHRRGFFREGFRQLFKPLAEIVEDRLQRAGVPFEDEPPLPGAASRQWAEPPAYPTLRPPGALEGEEFLDRCTSCAQCVTVCPVNAIKLARSDDSRLDGKPFIDPQSQACVICDELACMYACPTGALIPTPRDGIRMGLAVVRESLCVRSHGEDCQICVDKCPVGTRAIEIGVEGGPVVVHDDACTGCGVCQMYCPTEPRAIVVEPRRVG